MNEPIGLYLKHISKLIEKELSKNLEEFDITATQAGILIYLYKSKKIINQRELENKFNLTNPTINGILKRLENKNFIKKTTNKSDARNKEIHLTDKSVNVIKQLITKSNKMEKIITNNISNEELEMLKKIFHKMINNLGGKNETYI